MSISAVEPIVHERPTPPLLTSAFEGLKREHGFESLRVEGQLPEDLRGMAIRNGPAVFDAGVDPHWFDGVGGVAAVTIAQGEARGAVKLVHSPSADHDRGRSKPRYAGFGQSMSRLQKLRALFGGRSVRNLANVNVLSWRDRLFALYEAALPVELDPFTLDSMGESDLDGVVRGAWNAHPKYVPARRTTYQFGLRIGRRCFLDIDALPDAGSPRRLTSVRVPGVLEVHDFFATEHHLVFLITPFRSSSLELIRVGAFAPALRRREGEPTRVLVVPIDEPGAVLELETEPFFFWHGFNAYEHGDTLVLDFIRYDDFHENNRWICETAAGRDAGEQGSMVCRGIIEPRARRVRFETLARRQCEFPVTNERVHAREHRFGWSAGFAPEHDGRGWYDRLLRHEVRTGEIRDIDPGPNVAVGEPILVPRSNAEDDVWLMSFARDLDAGASFLGVWDGKSMDAEPIARVWFDQLLPPALHGRWIAR